MKTGPFQRGTGVHIIGGPFAGRYGVVEDAESFDGPGRLVFLSDQIVDVDVSFLAADERPHGNSYADPNPLTQTLVDIDRSFKEQGLEHSGFSLAFDFAGGRALCARLRERSQARSKNKRVARTEKGT